MTYREESRKLLNYLELVEEFPRDPTITQFEKILVAAKRAKDLHDHGKVELVQNHFTAPYSALEELKEGMIMPAYSEDAEPTELIEDDSEDAEEED